ncbi:MAG: DUF4376 domain-containing protein [Pseudomonadota bacterium]
MKHAHHNETTGEILGYYDNTIHAAIPQPSVELTDAEWQDCIDNNGLRRIDVASKKVVVYTPPLASVADTAATKNAEINAWRQTANLGSFAHGGKTVSCDALSRSDIDGVNGYVALYGAMPPDFPGAWKAVDNTYLLIADVAAWKAFYAAMVAQGAANFAHSQTLKAQLQAIIDANALPSNDPGYMTDDDARAAIEAIIP